MNFFLLLFNMSNLQTLKNCCYNNIIKNYCSECGNCLIDRIDERKSYDLNLLFNLLDNPVSDNEKYIISNDNFEIIYHSSTLRADLSYLIKYIKSRKVNNRIDFYLVNKLNNKYIKKIEKTNEFYKNLNIISDIMNRNNWYFYFNEVNYNTGNIELFLKDELNFEEYSIFDINKLYNSEFMLEGIKFKILSATNLESILFFRNIKKHFYNLKKFCINDQNNENNLLTLIGAVNIK